MKGKQQHSIENLPTREQVQQAYQIRKKQVEKEEAKKGLLELAAFVMWIILCAEFVWGAHVFLSTFEDAQRLGLFG